MEPEDSLPHSQVPATCPYPEPARSSPYFHISLPEYPLTDIFYVQELFFENRAVSLADHK